MCILILNWNGWQDTVACVESCRQLTYPDFRVLVVDNGSHDGSEAVLRECLPEVEVIQTGANLGFAGGNNAGIRHAMAQGAAYVWLLNNDTIVDPEALSALVRAAEGDRAAGMVGSKIVYHEDPRLLWFAGAPLDPACPHKLKHRGYNEVDHGQYDDIAPSGYVTGCSLLARSAMIEEVGLLDESLFLYYEDVDWSIRAAVKRWGLVYCPQSVVRHKVSVSSGGAGSPLAMYYCARNLLYFVRRNFPGRFYPALLFGLTEYVAVNFKKRRFSAAMGALRGIGDYFLSRMGRRS